MNRQPQHSPNFVTNMSNRSQLIDEIRRLEEEKTKLKMEQFQYEKALQEKDETTNEVSLRIDDKKTEVGEMQHKHILLSRQLQTLSSEIKRQDEALARLRDRAVYNELTRAEEIESRLVRVRMLKNAVENW